MNTCQNCRTPILCGGRGCQDAAPAVADAPPPSDPYMRHFGISGVAAPQEDAPLQYAENRVPSALVARAVQRVHDNIARREATEDVQALKALLAALAEKDAALREAEKTMGRLAMAIMQEQRDDLLDWARSVKVTFPDGEPIVAALGSKGATE